MVAMREIAERDPFTIKKPSKLDFEGVTAIVEQIISQFTFRIEKRRLSEELYHDDQGPGPRRDPALRRHAVACGHDDPWMQNDRRGAHHAPAKAPQGRIERLGGIGGAPSIIMTDKLGRAVNLVA